MKIVNIDTSQNVYIDEMVAWCVSNIGTGGWVGPASLHVAPSNYIWKVYKTVGGISFSFSSDRHYDKFISHFGVED